MTVFLHVFFPKSQKANLKSWELAEYSKAAQELAKLSNETLVALSTTRGWRELDI